MYPLYVPYLCTVHDGCQCSASLLLSLLEIQLSTKALELELSDMEGLEDPSVIEYFKKKFGKE